jgi:multisubunit Na+/H+ antiporter MnhB subunit
MISIGAILLVPLYSEKVEKRQQVEVPIHCLFSSFSAAMLIDCGLIVMVIAANNNFVVGSAITIFWFYLTAVLYQPGSGFFSVKDHVIPCQCQSMQSL